jgi:hypothetical protein
MKAHAGLKNFANGTGGVEAELSHLVLVSRDL